MAKVTVAWAREKALENFNEQYIHNMDKAKNLVNRYYRLCGADGRLCELENDERTYNRPYTKELAERTEKSYKRLKSDLGEFGLTVRYYGIYPTIEETETQRNALSTFFYG